MQRQFRHLANRLAEEEDKQAVRDALAALLQPHADEVAALKRTERWRDRLLEEGTDAIEAFVEQYPDADRGHLRQLVRNAASENERGKPPKSARLIFRYVRERIETSTDDRTVNDGDRSPRRALGVPPQIEDEELGPQSRHGRRLDHRRSGAERRRECHRWPP